MITRALTPHTDYTDLALHYSFAVFKQTARYMHKAGVSRSCNCEFCSYINCAISHKRYKMTLTLL